MGAGRVGRSAAWLLAAAAMALSGCGAGSGSVTARRPDGDGSGSVTARRGDGDGVPASLAVSARPIGAGPRFRPPVRTGQSGRPPHCAPALGRRYGVHLELFAADRVVLVAPGIGLRRPWRSTGGRITRARCYGPLATIDPTGVVLVRPGARLTVGDVFGAWGRPLHASRLLSFRASGRVRARGRPGTAGRVRAYVNGRRWTCTAPGAIPLRRHAEIVLELGPYVPPHRSFAFPPGE